MSSSLAIKIFKNPKQHKFPNIPKALPNTHFTALFIGSRGSGKSTVMRNVIDKYRKVFPLENRWMISPTAYQDDTLRPEFENDNIFTIYSEAIIHSIYDQIEADNQAQRARIFEVTVKQMLKMRKYEDIESPEELDPDELEEKYQNNLKRLFLHEEYLLVVDDSVGMFPPSAHKSELVRLFTKHRHLHISLMFSAQNFRSVPPIIRNNSMLVFLFDTNDKELSKLGEEFSNFKNHKNFETMFRKYVHEYNFLYINRMKKKSEQYRQNLNKAIKLVEFEK